VTDASNELAATEIGPGKFKVVIDDKETTFEIPIRTLYLRVLEIRSLRQFHDYEPKSHSLPELRLALRGTAVLEAGDTIEVIGDTSTRCSDLSIGFRAATESQHIEFVERYSRAMQAEWHELRNAAKTPGSGIFDDRLGVDLVPNVSLSFSAADWEIGNSDEWWIEVILSEKVIAELKDAVERRQFLSLKLGISAWNIFTDRSFYVPSDKGFHWFVRPGKYSPEMVRGVTTVMTLETARVTSELRDEQPISTYEPEREQAELQPQSRDDQFMNALRNEASELRKTIMRGALAICATIAALWLFFR
jgi:hypothetical protein